MLEFGPVLTSINIQPITQFYVKVTTNFSLKSHTKFPVHNISHQFINIMSRTFTKPTHVSIYVSNYHLNFIIKASYLALLLFVVDAMHI